MPEPEDPVTPLTAKNFTSSMDSRGQSPNCTGKGGAYRLDQPDDLDFLAGFGVRP